MNYVDFLLLIIVLLALWSGYLKGFIMGLVDLAVMLSSLWAAILFYPYVESVVTTNLSVTGVWARPLSFLLVIVLVRLILSLIFRQVLRDVSPKAHLTVVNKLFGLLPGFVNGLIYSAIVSALLLSIPINEAVSEHTKTSNVAPKLALQVEWLEDKLSPVFNNAVNRTINKITVEPQSKTTVDLQFTVANPTARPELEDKMLTLINAERMKRKLRALAADPEVLEVARAHSIDMFARGYFSHQTPEGLTPSDRVKKSKVRYLIMGENLALGQTLSICHRGLMNSPGHRANILSPNYTRVAIGIVDGGVHGLMVTQEFRN
ncbi:MAG: CvpA family protein [Chitinophagaceae bacterium]|nr:CvpA family protein [Chitinophagaceae bacterium]